MGHRLQATRLLDLYILCLVEIISSDGLQRLVLHPTGPTHKLGGTLDTIVTHDVSGRPNYVEVGSQHGPRCTASHAYHFPSLATS